MVAKKAIKIAPGKIKNKPAIKPPYMPLIRHPEYVANCIASGPGRSMQKLSAFKNCSSVNHFLFSTISRCISAI